MVFLKFTVLVCSLGTVFGQLNVEIISQKIEIFDKELVQEDLKIVEDDNGHPALDGTLTTTKPVGEDYMVLK
uniref:Uncharacterized protein n=1 Tax=Megaselia scalaris TaxID=36166 RepID=T1GYW3_MEGSC